MKLNTALRLGRTSNLPTVWTNVLAAAALSGGTLGPSPLLLAALAASALYVGGMFLNDAFDAEFDAEECPQRPIPAGEVSRTTVWRWGYGLLALGAILAFVTRPSAGFAAVATCGAIVAYNAWHKQNALSPVVMGLCRFGVYAIGAFAVTATPQSSVWLGGVLLMGYVLGLTYAAKFENRGGMGRWAPLLGLVAPAIVILLTWSGAPWLRSFFGGYAMWVQRAISLVRSGKPEKIRKAIGALIAGIALLDAMVVANCGSTGLALVCVAAFGASLAAQSRIAGT
ncbi:MAG: UbiA family prenyltransferase [Nannocystales bacterium]